MIMLPEHVKLILLSATVPNAMEFADWVGLVLICIPLLHVHVHVISLSLTHIEYIYIHCTCN